MGMGDLIGQRTIPVGDVESTCADWGPWDPPVKVSDNPRMFRQCHWTDCTMEWMTQTISTYQGDFECPGGYTLEWPAGGTGPPTCTSDSGGKSVSAQRGDPVEVYAEPVRHSKTWRAGECRYWSNWAAIKDASLRRRGHSLDPLAVVFEPVASGKFEIRGRPSGSSILVNGERVRGRTIDTSRLPIGLSVIGIVSNDAETDDRILLGLNVVSPLEIVVREPLVSAADGSEPVRFSLQVRNRSDADQLRPARMDGTCCWRAHSAARPEEEHDGANPRRSMERWRKEEVTAAAVLVASDLPPQQAFRCQRDGLRAAVLESLGGRALAASATSKSIRSPHSLATASSRRRETCGPGRNGH
jgi:hypothetical protein